jgi:hypothetical protein
MTLEKRNEIINFIGWREINDTDTGNWCSSAGITREIAEYDVNKVEITFICKISNTS